MPEQHQEQQSQQIRQRTRGCISRAEWLVVHHLACKTSIVLGYGGVFMKQAKTMEPNEAQQRHLDNPSAQTVFPIPTPPMHVGLSG